MSVPHQVRRCMEVFCASDKGDERKGDVTSYIEDVRCTFITSGIEDVKESITASSIEDA